MAQMTWAIVVWTAFIAAVLGALAAFAPIDSAAGNRSAVQKHPALVRAAREQAPRLAHTAQATTGGGSVALTWNSVLGEFNAVYTSTFAYCDDTGFCGWYPIAWEQPSSAPTCDVAWRDNLVYVEPAPAETGPATVTETDSFIPTWTSGVICLAASTLSGDFVLASTTYTVPAVAPPPRPPLPPAPAPASPSPGHVPFLSATEAKGYVKKLMRHVFHGSFTQAYDKRYRGYKRLARTKVRWSKVSWIIGDAEFLGRVTIWATRTHWYGSYRIKMYDTYCLSTHVHHCTKVFRR